jgi:hypothetical protein
MNKVGSLVFVHDMWHKVLEVHNDGKDYLVVSPLWWKSDKWISADEVEHTKADDGQIDFV